MERDLRQGDHISPFLFVLATEAINQTMKSAIEKNIFQGLKVKHREVNVSHLQFADDTMIFCTVKRKFLTNLRRMLDCVTPQF